MKIRVLNISLLLPFLLMMASCTSISPYNETAYKYATSIKASSLQLLDKAQSTTYSANEKDIDALMLESRKAYEYALQRPNNEDSSDQWKIVLDPEESGLAGFMKKWKKDKQLNAQFVQFAKKEISTQFDQISALESGKVKKQ